MKFPFVVQKNLSDILKNNYKQRFFNNGYDRSVRENVWRRHQDESNKEFSGWVDGDYRRRLLHFRDKYALIDNDFCIVSTYLFLGIKAPQLEIDQYKEKINYLTKKWARIGQFLYSEDLCLSVVEKKIHEADIEACRHTPNNYSNLDITISSSEYSNVIKHKPWKILKTGIRQKLHRGTPTIIQKSDLDAFYPAQVELGCGPSIETGIPPLNYFHKLFSLHKDGKFVFKEEDDSFIDFFYDPCAWYEKAAFIHKKCLNAMPNSFYYKLKLLSDQGKIVGPIINNNFDGLSLSVGLEEIPLRQYDEDGIYPSIDFHQTAKSLFVIGSHADRRKCQFHAKNKGLKIVYIDPEGYDGDNDFVAYPLESPQNEDFVLKIKASDF